MRTFVLSIVCAACFGVRSLPAEQASDVEAKRKDLIQIEEEKKHVQQELKGLDKNEHSTMKQLEGLNRRLNAHRRDLQANQRKRAQVEKRLIDLKAKMVEQQLSIDRNRSMLKRELKAVYKAGPLKGVDLLLSASTPAELMSRARNLRTLAAHNSRRLGEIHHTLEGLQQNKVESESRRIELEKRKAAVEQARLREDAEKQKREAFLETVRKEKSRNQGLLRELEESQRQLGELIQRLQGRAQERTPVKSRKRSSLGTEDSGPSKLGRKGSLLRPVKGPVISRFGKQNHPLLHTIIFNRGIEIAAPIGTPVHAVADGMVEYADEFPGLGQMVILNHGGGVFTVYGHNSALTVKEKQEVTRGQTIAEVGDSLTLKRSALYFEIRSQARSVNPLEWFSR